MANYEVFECLPKAFQWSGLEGIWLNNENTFLYPINFVVSIYVLRFECQSLSLWIVSEKGNQILHFLCSVILQGLRRYNWSFWKCSTLRSKMFFIDWYFGLFHDHDWMWKKTFTLGSRFFCTWNTYKFVRANMFRPTVLLTQQYRLNLTHRQSYYCSFKGLVPTLDFVLHFWQHVGANIFYNGDVLMSMQWLWRIWNFWSRLLFSICGSIFLIS